MANNNKGHVDNGQVMKRVFDASIEALRMIPAESTEFAIELSATDGDSVKTPNSNSLDVASSPLTTGASGDAIAAQSSVGTKSIQLYGEVTAVGGASTAGAITVRIDVSPSDSGAFFQTATTLSIPMGSAVGAVVQSSILSCLSKRIKVTITANALAAGDIVKFYLIGGSN